MGRKEQFVLIHFFHPDFHRCQIMDARLSVSFVFLIEELKLTKQEIAPKYRHTLFVRASVADSLFLVAKFEVKVLPCVMSFVNGKCVDR
jgi:thioredoxin-like negative regulator of GroEL